ncbi:thioredoxin-like protein [Limtongia smithiae]|uniref:thioredoxin-like protein n=1 Tax=Limtongia smithiae TaxID=1125753 RepID=UPI0034CD6104
MPPRKAAVAAALADPSTLRRSSRNSKAVAAPEEAAAVIAAPPAKKAKVEKVKKGAKKGKPAKEEKEEEEEEEAGEEEKKEEEESKLPTPVGTDAEDVSATVAAEAAAVEEPTKEEPVANPNAVLQLGDALPDVAVLDHAGVPVNLHTLASTTPTIVIFAYPKASTPGCTRQACGFRDAYPEFTASAGVAVFGLSADTPAAQLKFKEKQNLPYSLLADTEYKLLGPLGAKKTAKGGITRSYWVVKDGKLVTMVIGVKPEVSVEKALAEVTAE